MAEDWQAGGFGLYIHWPFCQAKCPYCDFNSHVVASIDQTRWRDAYLREVDRVAALVPDRVLSSVFFGGGTPSLMDPDVVAAVLDHVRGTWPQANAVEVTLEANPSSVEAGRFAAYAQAGVNRVSMGVQALNDPDLKRLGRLHSAAEARAAFEIARAHFDRVSFDLIYARQDQTLEDWRTELTEALAMAVDHLSLYQLTIEQGTAFGDRYNRGLLRGLPNDDLQADMYALTQDLCEAAGMPAYEVSNHAHPGAQSRHNLIYWRYGDYAGIGPGAHGRLTINGRKMHSVGAMQPGRWLTLAEAGDGTDKTEDVPDADQATEMLMMGLRLVDGIDMDRYVRLAGKRLDAACLADLRGMGFVEVNGSRLRATQSGLPILNALIERLIS